MKPTSSGSLLGTVPGPKDVKLPELTGWKTSAETPEADPGFDDSSWTYADKLTTNNPTKPGTLPVLYQDEYGYHYGYVWYRGRFKATGTEKSLSLAAYATNPDTGSAAVGAYSVWINGKFAGTSQTGRKTFPIADGAAQGQGERDLRPGRHHGPQRGLHLEQRRPQAAARPDHGVSGRAPTRRSPGASRAPGAASSPSTRCAGT